MPAEVHVAKVAENVDCIEVTVAMGSTPRPEAVLFDTIAGFLAEQPTRKAVLGATFFYDNTECSVVGVIFLGETIPDESSET